MTEEFIDYGELIDDAMHIIVRKALEIVKEKGLLGDHHFFISFVTQFPGVEISDKLLKQYPEEMTIVLQYQFDDLVIDKKGFSVKLSFSGVKERLYVPFAALTAFADPSVKFGLQFRHLDDDFDDEMFEQDIISEIHDVSLQDQSTQDTKPKKKTSAAKDKASDKKTSGKGKGKGKKELPSNVITLDSFRKKD